MVKYVTMSCRAWNSALTRSVKARSSAAGWPHWHFFFFVCVCLLHITLHARVVTDTRKYRSITIVCVSYIFAYYVSLYLGA